MSLRTSSTWIKVALISLLIAVVLFVIAFSTSVWVSHSYRGNYQSLGLWKARYCTPSLCRESKLGYNWDTDFHHAVQAMECLGLIGIFLGLIFLLLYICVESIRRRTILILTTVFVFVSVFFIVVGIAVCADKYEDRGYHIGWSMGLAIAAAIFDFIAGIMCVLQLLGVN